MGWRVVSEELGYNGASNADRGKGWQVSELRMYYLDNCSEQSKLGGTPMASGQLHPADGEKRTEERVAEREMSPFWSPIFTAIYTLWEDCFSSRT